MSKLNLFANTSRRQHDVKVSLLGNNLQKSKKRLSMASDHQQTFPILTPTSRPKKPREAAFTLIDRKAKKFFGQAQHTINYMEILIHKKISIHDDQNIRVVLYREHLFELRRKLSQHKAEFLKLRSEFSKKFPSRQDKLDTRLTKIDLYFFDVEEKLNILYKNLLDSETVREYIC